MSTTPGLVARAIIGGTASGTREHLGSEVLGRSSTRSRQRQFDQEQSALALALALAVAADVLGVDTAARRVDYLLGDRQAKAAMRSEGLAGRALAVEPVILFQVISG